MLNYLEDKLGSKAYTEMVDAYQQAYRRSHTAIDENKTAREAANEMVNDTLFALFSSKEGMQDMIDWTSETMPAQERKTFLETFKSILDDVIKALNHFLKTGSFNSVERAALEMEKDQAKAMRQMVLDAMDVAIENRDKAAGASEIVDSLAIKGRKSIRVDEPVSANDELVAIHNTTPQQLIDTIKLGGFPAPSIAIVKASMSHEKYGQVSVVFGRDTIDPELSSANSIFGGDAWTAVFPTIEYKLDEKVIDRVKKYLDDKLPGKLRNIGGYDCLDIHNASQMLGQGGLVDSHYASDARFGYLFITEELGQKVEIPTKDEASQSGLSVDEINEFIEKYGADYLNALQDNRDEYIELSHKLPAVLNEIHYSNYLKNNPDVDVDSLPKFKQRMIKERFKTDSWTLGKTDRFFADVNKLLTEGGFGQVIDEYAFSDNVKAIVEQHSEEYGKWLNKLFDGVFEKQGLRNNKEFYTSTGKQRSWEALHDDITLDNIVKLMSEQDEQGATGIFSQSVIQALATKKFKSIDEVKSAMYQLRMMTDEEYSAEKAKFGERADAIAREIQSNKENSFIAYQEAFDAIADAVREGTSEKVIARELKKYGSLNLKPDTAKKISELMADMSEMVTGYFEAKPRRAVYLDEILKVVCPSTETELVSVLEDNNIPYETYEEGNEKARKEAVNTTGNARFSKKVLDDGRVADNLADVLTIEEYAELRSMIDSGNKPTYKTNTKEAVYRLDNKLVYTDSRKLNFGISKIVDVNNYKDVSDVNAILDLYSDIDTEGVNYEQQIRLIESYFGKKCFTEYTTKDWGNTERYDRPTKRNKGRSDAYHAEREQNRKRVFIKDGVVVEDTRKSVKVTDARNSFKEYGEASPYTDSLEEVEVVSTILSKANQALGGIKSVKESSLNRISRSVIKKYKSNVEVEELSKNIFQAFSQMAENKLESNYESVMDYMLNIGDEVIANSQLKDPDSERVYNEARKNLQSYNIKLTENDKEELKNAYGTLIKGMGTLKKHGINLSKEGHLSRYSLT